MHFLKQGMKWEQACKMTRAQLEGGKDRREFFDLLERQERDKSKKKEPEPSLWCDVKIVMSSFPWVYPLLSTRG